MKRKEGMIYKKYGINQSGLTREYHVYFLDDV